MKKPFKLKSNAKINITLNVVGKKKNNKLHPIESLVSFIDLADEINIKEINFENHKVKFYGSFAYGIPKINTVSKLLKLLDKKKLLKKKYQFLIKKNIPQKSGMGGGSMNASTILTFFEKQKILTKKQTIYFAKKIGSDVILGLNKCSKILKNNKVYKVKKAIKFNLLLVKPNFGCSTKKIFALNKVFTKQSNLNIKKTINKKLIISGKNDLEESAFKIFPRLKELKKELISWEKAELVRMTGSGSTLVMYFNSILSAKNALKISKRKLNKCWCILSKVI